MATRIKTAKDLELLRHDVESGLCSISAIAKNWGICRNTIKSYRKKYGWGTRNKEIQQITIDKLAKNNHLISDINRKELVDKGGNELYDATVTYFKNAANVQKSTQINLQKHDQVFTEMEAGLEKDKNLTITENLKAEEVFYIVQQQKMETLLTSQKFIQGAAKATTEVMNGVRASLGLNNNDKDKQGDINVNILIADGLRKGRERMVQMKTAGGKDLSQLVMPEEPLNQ